KTGTSQDVKDTWFIGTNPNVTFGTWIGYDTPSSVQCPGCSLSYPQRNQELWTRMVNALSDVDSEIMAPSKSFTQPDNIVLASYCEILGIEPFKRCEKLGLVKSDLYNSRYTSRKTEDSLVEGDVPMTLVDGKDVVASAKTTSAFTNEDGSSFAFTPGFQERKG